MIPPRLKNALQVSRLLRLCAMCVLFAMLAGCGTRYTSQEKPPHAKGQLFLATGAPIFVEDIVQRYNHADYILIGEVHTNATAKLVAAALLAELTRQGKRPTLGLEMLSVKEQFVLDIFNRRHIPLEIFPEAIQWKKNWGYEYALYEPLIAAAHQYNSPIYGLNIPHIVLRKAVEGKGSNLRFRVPVSERRWLPSQTLPPPENQLEELRQVFNAHQARRQATNHKTTATFARFLHVQSLWDSSMAENAVKARQKHNAPVLILAGSSHVESGYGIASRLRVFDPESTVILVMPIGDPELLLQKPQGMPDKVYTKLARSADIFYYAPAKAHVR